MLPDQFRFAVHNESNQTVDANSIIVKYRGKYFDSNGKLIFELESSDVIVQSSLLAHEALLVGTTIDNGAKSNPIVEADVHFDIDLVGNAAPAPDGAITLYLQRATAVTPVFTTDLELRHLDAIASIHFRQEIRKHSVVTVF